MNKPHKPCNYVAYFYSQRVWHFVRSLFLQFDHTLPYVVLLAVDEVAAFAPFFFRHLDVLLGRILHLLVEAMSLKSIYDAK